MSAATTNNPADEAQNNLSLIKRKTSRDKRQDKMKVIGYTAGPYEESWEPGMADRIRDIVEAKEKSSDGKSQQYPFCMVALCGIPGSGKSVSSLLLANALEQDHGIECMIMPHDGYHYPIDVLKTFPDAEDAIYRRGAPDTFDPQALVRDLNRIRGTCLETGALLEDATVEHVLHLPGFDHARGDPEPDKHTFDRSRHKVVICEGLYLMHDQDGWEDVPGFFDLKIFLQSDLDNCIERLKIRNLCIPGYTPEQIEKRCEEVDRANAHVVRKSIRNADVTVKSRQHPVPPKHSHKKTESFIELDLAGMGLKDLRGGDIDEHHDWTMDINTMLRSPEPTPMHSRNNSMTSLHSEPPQPASQFVGTWEPTMAERIGAMVEERIAQNGKFPCMVSLVGAPGGGKSISSMLLASLLEDKGFPTMVCPHDGYHYPMDYLRTFPDADDFIYRRGAPDTFDPRALKRDLDRIKEGDEDLIKLPAFDHATGDPEPDTHIFDRKHHKIVLCEGLYLLHDEDGWEDIASVFDLSIFMNADVDVCVERVKIRNQCIPGYTPEEIEKRSELVDRVNAMTVLRSRTRADVVVDSMALKR